MIPVSVIITTRNEEKRIARCLAALRDFSEIIVVDSASSDRTQEIAREHGASVVNFEWNGRYPKKRQWCLDHLTTKHDWIFFVDADEEMTKELIAEIRALDFSCAGYFVKGQYVYEGRALRFGLKNNKLVLFDRCMIEFPVVDDLDVVGMGEMEGHYQPVLKSGAGKLGQLKNCMLHHAHEDKTGWSARHQRYASWERGMNAKAAWPSDPVAAREFMKRAFRALPGRGLIAFFHCYIMKLGFIDGVRGWRFARGRLAYYRGVAKH